MTREHRRRALRSVVLAALAACAAAGVSAACSNGSGGTPGESCPNLSTDCPATPPSWQNDVQPIITSYCFPCHGEGGIEQSQFDYTSYAGVYRNRAAMLTQVYQCQMPPSDASPPAPMPPSDVRQTLLSWLVCGAPDN